MRLINVENPNVTAAAEKLHQLKIDKGLIDPYQKVAAKLRTSTALMIDAVYLLYETLKELQISPRDIQPLYCNLSNSWEKGSTIVNFMKAVSNLPIHLFDLLKVLLLENSGRTNRSHKVRYRNWDQKIFYHRCCGAVWKRVDESGLLECGKWINHRQRPIR